MLSLNDYQIAANRTINKDADEKWLLVNVGLGLTGEAGEVADMLKKHLTHSHVLDKTKIVKELGDVLWYIAEAAYIIGVSLEDIAQTNIDKLRQRYPDGFTSERSINREENNVGR